MLWFGLLGLCCLACVGVVVGVDVLWEALACAAGFCVSVAVMWLCDCGAGWFGV